MPMNNPSTPKTVAAIRDIAFDNLSGAAEILRRAEGVFSLLMDESSRRAPISIEDAQVSIREASIALAKAQPDMSSLLRLASAALSAARAEVTGRDALEAAAGAACRFVESATNSAHAAAMHAVSLIGEGSKILTHSRSSTVLEALLEARRAGKQFKVIATESRPMLEGRKSAHELSSDGIHVTMIADAAASLFIESVDLILVGADRITPEHIVNKVGTKMIALAARERGVPIYAVCETSKFVAADYLADVIRDQRDPRELWPDAPEGIAVSNSYFEPTPLAFFNGVITERGALSGSEASACAREADIDPGLVDLLRYQIR
jgi:translation initiation factor 2B subunit (eIF-2B alpha/beta/delta family)